MAPLTTRKVLCQRCDAAFATVKLTATDAEGTLLDSKVVCRGCAGRLAFEVGEPTQAITQRVVAR